ncbi:hypothetical protein ANCCEY_06465 [Ancylostoma ceylanicum]|uniref:Uncharacterized protein n=2 Tax=Ancylostoma ceylanicum TaxID=53326 RepID=A0A0D6LQY1_9BILA|nr:hypothetical protein ANCCEY_06465 [Ancylostoma ceylanicum]EYB89920.1 hypothetical protein Y032_0226g2777 [Ancylostoma ceylanicum]
MQKWLAVAQRTLVFQRNRATYFQQQKRFPPAFIRRFFLRYPQAHLYIVFGLLSSAMLGPAVHSVYLFMTLTPEEFERYRFERTAVVKERQKYGKYLWIPFYSSGEMPKEELPAME